jgi:hypothetical protein
MLPLKRVESTILAGLEPAISGSVDRCLIRFGHKTGKPCFESGEDVLAYYTHDSISHVLYVLQFPIDALEVSKSKYVYPLSCTTGFG